MLHLTLIDALNRTGNRHVKLHNLAVSVVYERNLELIVATAFGKTKGASESTVDKECLSLKIYGSVIFY